MNTSSRQTFIDYVRGKGREEHIVSPFLPNPSVVQNTLKEMGFNASGDRIGDEIELARQLGYQPMFMTGMSELIFDWQKDDERSDGAADVYRISTPCGDWLSVAVGEQWNDSVPRPVQTEEDHRKLAAVCKNIEQREGDIRDYFRNFRRQVGEDGVIVIGHPHPSWLAMQIAPQDIFFQFADWPDVFTASMDAIYKASLFVMSVAMAEGIDFMSDSSYGLEMTSPGLFAVMDLPYMQKYSVWTHEHSGLFWYHNCGQTRKFILDGTFNSFGADVIETIAGPPEGDNDLAESRKCIDPDICTKGNFSLTLLRDGTPDDIRKEARRIAHAVAEHKHIFSTADAVLDGTPPRNFIAMIEEFQRAGCS